MLKIVRSWPVRVRYAVALFVVAALGATAIIAKDRDVDPLYAEFDAFLVKVEGAFKPSSNKKGIQNLEDLLAQPEDKTLAPNSKELIALQDEFAKFKKRLEDVSVQRRDLLVEDPWIYSLSEISMLYLNQVRRLISNNFRNAHSKIGLEKTYSPAMYDYLNLVMNGQVGVSLIQNEKDFEDIFDNLVVIRYMISHLYDKETGGYDRVLLGFTPQDKDTLEQQVLSANISEQGYAKFVHFLATRARITNQYSLQRMEMPVTDPLLNRVYFSNLQDPALNSCGENFISFRQPSIGRGDDYYHALLKEDRYSDYQAHVTGGLMQMALLEEPIVTKEKLARILSKFIFTIPEFEAMVLPEFVKDYSPADISEKKKKADELILTKFAPALLNALEKEWSKSAEKVMLLANYVGDSWDPQSVADRISWAGWEKRKKLLLGSLVKEVKAQKLTGFAKAGEDRTVDEILAGLAEQAVKSELNKSDEDKWRARIRQNIANYLGSPAGTNIVKGSQERRFNEVFDFAWNSIQSGAKAYYVRKLTDKVRRENIGREIDRAWKDDPGTFKARWSNVIVNVAQNTVETATGIKLVKSLFGMKDRPSQYYRALYTMTHDDIGGMMLPARGLMATTVHPYTPDQLSQYFRKKLDFWREQKSLPDLKKRADAIANNKAVMKSIETFFNYLSADYMDQVSKRKLKAKDIGPDDGILYGSLNVVTKPAYAQFLKLISTAPTPAPTPEPTPEVPLWEVYAANSKTQSKWVNELYENVYSRFTSEARNKLPGAIFVDVWNSNWREHATSVTSKFKTVFLVIPHAGFKVAAEDRKLVDWTITYPFTLADLYNKVKLLPMQKDPKFRKDLMSQPMARDGTYVRPNRVENFNNQNLANKTDYVDPFSRGDVIRLYMDAMSMMGLSRHYFNEVASELVTTKFTMKTFLKIESLLDGDSPVRTVERRIAMSVLDQKLLADVLYGVAIAEHPMLAIQPQGGADDPNGLDFIGVMYDAKTGLNRSIARDSIKNLVSRAADNQKRYDLVAEACRAKPFEDGNRDWRNVFRASTGTRAMLKGVNPKYQPFDDAIMKSTRTGWEVAMDRLDVAAQWLFYATMIVMAVGLAWTGFGAIAGAYVLGDFALGAAIAMDTLTSAIATTAGRAGIKWTKKFLMTAIGKFITYVFTAQILTMGYVNCFHLPPHTRYLLGVANSEVGIHTRVTADRNEIRAYANQIFIKQIMFVPMMGLQIPMLRPIMADIRTLFGMPMYSRSLKNMVTEGTQGVVNKMKTKSLSEWISSEGSFTAGFKAWAKQTGNSIWKTWHIAAVGEKATIEQLNTVMAPRLLKLFPNPQVYEELVGSRVTSINKSGAKLYNWILRAHENPTWHTNYQMWLRKNLAKYVLRDKYVNFAMSEAANANMAVIVNGNLKRLSQNHVFWEIYARAHLADILNNRGYWEQRLAMLSSLKGELISQAISNKQSLPTDEAIMQRYLQGMSAYDVGQHKKLMDWVLVQTSGPVTAFVRKHIGSTNAQVNEYKRMFRDYNALAGEINALAPKVVEDAAYDATEDFALFGLTMESSADDLKKAYRRESMKFHPDHAAENGLTPEEATVKFQEISLAKERLDKWFETRSANPFYNGEFNNTQLLLPAPERNPNEPTVTIINPNSAEKPGPNTETNWDKVATDINPEDVVVVVELDPLTQEPVIAVNTQAEAKRKNYNIFKMMKEKLGFKD